ncbi:MAG: iron-containing alcohol dehydrogenase [Deltaproteobacteria bacterium]|nr:iron-containing alcohol dehydrogenase [Deltaproteobacteria bacterium]
MEQNKRIVWPMDEPVLRTVVTTFNAPETKLLVNVFSFPKVFYALAGLQIFVGAMSQMGRKKAFIITDKGVKELARIVEKALKGVGIETEIADDVEPEVPLHVPERIAKKIGAMNPDLIVAVGGGSVMDTAKVAWILYEVPDANLTAIDPLKPLGLRKKALLACIPTTAGTGSEATNVAVVHDETVSPPRKQGVVHPELYPDFALLDPRFIVRMPRDLTIGTALDALSHAVDCFLCRSSNPISDALAIKATKMVINYLPLVLERPSNLQLRLRTQVAALIAGAAFSNGGIGTTHALAHNIGTIFGVHHGMACGVTIPYVIKFYSEVDDKYMLLAEELGLKNNTGEILQQLVAYFKNFLRRVGAPTTLKELGVEENSFQRNLDVFTRYAVMDPTGPMAPRQPTFEEMRELIENMYYGRL